MKVSRDLDDLDFPSAAPLEIVIQLTIVTLLAGEPHVDGIIHSLGIESKATLHVSIYLRASRKLIG